jgi:glycosyltransferase involved in cell wall biosynthesis
MSTKPFSELPTITIITPTLNQGMYIKETIDSVLNQGYPALDYQVWDGGSTDQTHSILQSYGKNLCWISEPDRGQSNAINKGWLKSRGDIVAWLNSDDCSYPGALEHVGAFFSQHPEVDMLYGDCEIINEAGKFLQFYPTKPFDFEKLILHTENYIPQPAAFIRKKVLEDIGYLDETLNLVMDFDYWLRAGKAHQIVYIQKRLAQLRTHRQAKSIASLGNFGKELVFIYQKFFASPDLPDYIRPLKQRAMSNIYYRAADCSYWGRQLLDARRFAWKSWQFYPARLRRLWFYLALGKLGRNIADKKYRNPYILQGHSDGEISDR